MMVPNAPPPVLARRSLRVAGVVQGVGFRPFVYRLATELGLSGTVGNDSAGVFVEVEGLPAALASFEHRLVVDAPPLARIAGVRGHEVAPRGDHEFVIAESRAAGGGRTFVSPDVATCRACTAELFDPRDRRYRYPFINCTDCGPRFTITRRLPYDRPNTTMAGFELCGDCSAEYHDPRSRRFHAEPVACAACGPRVNFEGPEGHAGTTDGAIAAAQRALARGQIVAVKGLGGYHLACDARSDSAVQRLRSRKHRPDKPLAVMVADVASGEKLAAIRLEEAALLSSWQRPIVLLDRREDAALSSLVAPGNPYVGLLLPYTPLHLLVFRPVPGSDAPVPEVLVMTSGNVTDEPICFEDDDARRRLGAIADAWLTHDRPIFVPCDDSVVRVESARELPVRRSRGYAPLPLRLPFDCDPILATGGELKNTFCLASGWHAWMSQHIGDMGNLETTAAFERSVRQFGDLYDVEPARLAADAHPGYLTRRWAERRAGDGVILVQHHHAHIAAVMAEARLPERSRVLGFAFDGTGYGTDGAIWGGELLVAGYGDFERAGHLRYVDLPGGDSTIRKPYRAALAHLRAAGVDWRDDLWPVRRAGPVELGALDRQLERRVSCVPSSSMGRLFDAVSALLGVRQTVSYEAQSAIELETVARRAPGSPSVETSGGGRPYHFALDGAEFDPGPVLRGVVGDLRAGRPVGEIAFAFHDAVAELMVGSACRIRSETGIDVVALSGGVFQNVLLLRLAREGLVRSGFQVLTHGLVPPNDGGLALGQLVVAGFGCREGKEAS